MIGITAPGSTETETQPGITGIVRSQKADITEDDPNPQFAVSTISHPTPVDFRTETPKQEATEVTGILTNTERFLALHPRERFGNPDNFIELPNLVTEMPKHIARFEELGDQARTYLEDLGYIPPRLGTMAGYEIVHFLDSLNLSPKGHTKNQGIAIKCLYHYLSKGFGKEFKPTMTGGVAEFATMQSLNQELQTTNNESNGVWYPVDNEQLHEDRQYGVDMIMINNGKVHALQIKAGFQGNNQNIYWPLRNMEDSLTMTYRLRSHKARLHLEKVSESAHRLLQYKAMMAEQDIQVQTGVITVDKSRYLKTGRDVANMQDSQYVWTIGHHILHEMEEFDV